MGDGKSRSEGMMASQKRDHSPAHTKGKKDAAKFEAEVKFNKTHDQPLPFSARDGVHFDELAQEWVNVKKAQGA